MSQSWGSVWNILITVRWFLKVCLHIQVTRQDIVSHTVTLVLYFLVLPVEQSRRKPRWFPAPCKTCIGNNKVQYIQTVLAELYQVMGQFL